MTELLYKKWPIHYSLRQNLKNDWATVATMDELL
jgi:hypothetical protein